MFIKRFELFKLLGFPIRVDLSWFFVLLLLTWMLATGGFPHWIETFEPEAAMPAPGMLWTMGFLAALALFISVLLHELGHAIVARWYDIAMNGITLFFFGGVAEMQEEPPSAKSEFWVAIAGPVVSVALAVSFGGAAVLLREIDADIALVVVTGWLGFINGMLVAFNMVPAYPLDGGRVLRAILWAVRNDLRWATRISSGVGSTFGLVLVALGALIFISGGFMQGAILAILGLFLRNAALMSYQQLLVRRALEGERVAQFMKDDPVAVTPDMTLAELVSEYVYRHYFKMYPVVENGRVLGCITTRRIKEVPQEQWSETRVGDVMDETSEHNTISADDDAMRAMSRMNSNELSRLMVVDGDQLVGIIALKDLLRFLSLRVDMDEGV